MSEENSFAWRHYMYKIEVFEDSVVITEENLLTEQREQVVIPDGIFEAMILWWKRRADER